MGQTADGTLPEQIARQLRRDILRGKLVPGAPIKERDNAAELGVSRTPMREAIRILAQEGLIDLRPSRSPVVAAPSFKELADQIDVLLVLEMRSAERACAHATDAEIAGIGAIVEHMADHFGATDPLDMFEIDMSFHTAIARASHNPPMAETHQRFLQRLWRARYISAIQRRNRERVVGEHREIVEAIRARDPMAARAAIEHHLGHLAEDIRLVIEAEASNTSTGSKRTGEPE